MINDNPKFSLAPMEGVTDFPTRLWLSLCSGIKDMTTPFLRVTSTFPHKKKPPLQWAPDIFDPDIASALDIKTIPQLMAADPNRFIEVAEDLLQFSDHVELNCGCPSSKVVGKGAGSRLLENTDTFTDMTKTIATHLPAQRFSIKMRLGYDTNHLFKQQLQEIDSLGLKRLTIHGRTAKEKYTGKANWSSIETAAKQSHSPIIGSGDICDLNSFRQRQLSSPHTNAFLIGRGALRNPWIFLELRRKKQIEITKNTLLYSLACYALLIEMYSNRPPDLIKLIQKGTFTCKPLNYEHLWEQLFFTVSSYGSNKKTSLENIEINRFSLGRLKLLWHYLRSSLPPIFMTPSPLRSRQSNDFFSTLSHLTVHPTYLLSWKPELDWIYSGEKKP